MQESRERQERRDAGQEGFRTGGMQDRWNSGHGKPDRWDANKRDSRQEVCRKEEMLDRRETGKVECRTGRMQERRDAGKQGCRNGGTKERRYLIDEGCKFSFHTFISTIFLHYFTRTKYCIFTYYGISVAEPEPVEPKLFETWSRSRSRS